MNEAKVNSALAALTGGAAYTLREFNSNNASEYAFEFAHLLPTSLGGSTGDPTWLMYSNVQPPFDFGWHVPLAQSPTAAPASTINPLLGPQWALSFLGNVAPGAAKSSFVAGLLGG